MHFKTRLGQTLVSPAFERLITGLILAGAITLGLQTYPEFLHRADAALGMSLSRILAGFDWLLLVVFAVEISARVLTQGRAFLRDPWNIFDAVVVAASLLGESPMFAALRVLRVFRILRLLNRFKSLRLLSGVLWQSVGGCASIGLLMGLVLFVFGIIGHQLYGETNPALFGNLHLAVHTLFRVAGLYAYDDVVAAVVEKHPWVYLYLIPYFLIMSYVVVNFFSAIVVYYLYELSAEEIKSGQRNAEQTEAQTLTAVANAEPAPDLLVSLLVEVRQLRQEVAALKKESA